MLSLADKEKMLSAIIRHIQKVEDNCNLLAKKLASEDFKLALRIVQLGRIHDASKFEDFEFHHLHRQSPQFEEALKLHHSRNPHHPEHWSSIHAMPDEYLAEMVCDCAARGQEFGTNVKDWFETQATVKYNFEITDQTGQKIKKYLDLILTPSFT
jgi:hypothetical protein